jgi:hypothetical protein
MGGCMMSVQSIGYVAKNVILHQAVPGFDE